MPLRVRHVLPIALLLAVAWLPPTRRLGARFFDSLRLAKPQPVTAAGNTLASGTGRQLQDAVAGMLAHTPAILLDEADQPAATADAASSAAGFGAHLVRARHDPPAFTVLGAHAVRLSVDRAVLRTILDQAGRRDIATPASLDGSTLVLRSPRSLRIQYGNCPPAGNTIQGQISGPPPPSAENANCLVLVESPSVAADVPAGLAMDDLTEIALELGGLSPNQTHAFARVADWRSALMLSIPRGIRAYDTLSVAGAPAMLMTTAGRRGPTYALIWRRDALTYLLAGYGNPADAATLAASVD